MVRLVEIDATERLKEPIRVVGELACNNEWLDVIPRWGATR